MDDSKNAFLKALSAKAETDKKVTQNKLAFLAELRDASETIFRDIKGWLEGDHSQITLKGVSLDIENYCTFSSLFDQLNAAV